MSKRTIEMSVPAAEAADYTEDGWQLIRAGLRKARLGKPKEREDDFADRIWTLLYRMGFNRLSGIDGALLVGPGETESSLSIVAIDDEVAIFVESRTSERRQRAPRFLQSLAELAQQKSPFQRAVTRLVGVRKVAALSWSENVVIGPKEQDAAIDNAVRLFDASELEYYEHLVRELGFAAKYQFLADVYGDSKVEGLTLRLPAVRLKLGPTRCFAFAIKPSKLLRIAYVSHRAKGKEDPLDTYQRLVKRSRIKSIREYIVDGGYFPTNIVVNLRPKRPLEFHPAATPENVDSGDSVIGWLVLPNTYKSAWIIDGQHRLFAYAGQASAEAAELSVLAFESLSEREQARLFVDINSKQKNVKQNLLVELAADLHWNSDNVDDRLTAIIARIVLRLDTDPESPFFEKIIKADESAKLERSISLRSMTQALEHPELFFSATRSGGIVPGLFWHSDPNETIKRASEILNFWFNSIVRHKRMSWDAGKGPGGGIAMNDSVVANVTVLRSIVRDESENGTQFERLSTAEVCKVLQRYADIVAEYFGAMTEQQLSDYRKLRGVEGQTTRYREIQIAVKSRCSNFSPAGLDEYERSRDKDVLAKARQLLDDIELLLQEHVVGTLKREFGVAERDWFFKGVPKNMRERVFKDINEEGQDAPKESKFYLIDYRNLAVHNWRLFDKTLAREKANQSKEKRTEWMVRLNDIRRHAAHASKGSTGLERASPEDVQFLTEIDSWLRRQLDIVEVDEMD